MTQAPQEHQELIRRVLGANYLELELQRLWVDEDLGESTAATSVKARVSEKGQTADVEGKGVGVLDALFHALLARYAIEYQSLKTLRLAGFSVSAELDGKDASTDAVGTVTIDVTNSDQRRFTFSDSSRSVTASIGRAAVAVVQYFVNAERAFITLFNARKDALERGRPDLVARYTAELSEVVESTSYAEVIEAKKREIR